MRALMNFIREPTKKTPKESEKNNGDPNYIKQLERELQDLLDDPPSIFKNEGPENMYTILTCLHSADTLERKEKLYKLKPDLKEKQLGLKSISLA